MFKAPGIGKLASACLIIAVAILSACDSRSNGEADSLNMLSYEYHYRNIDSTEHYARHALKQSADYSDGKAEAYNNLAFASISRMEYETAARQLDSVRQVSDNQIELLVADVQNMRLCQRMSDNKAFYDHRESARRRMRRIEEARSNLTARQRQRLEYACSEFAIVTSVYYYYVGLERQAAEAMEEIDVDAEMQKDTAQYLSYLYNIGSGGIISTGSQEDILKKEMEYLIRCYSIASHGNYPYWQANALQAISEHIQSSRNMAMLTDEYRLAMKYINDDNMPDSLLAGNLAQRSLDIFTSFGDVYQVAGAYRTLAQCYMQIGDYNSALICLNAALSANKAIEQAPDLVASIREQLSVAYSAVDDKQNSDINRNIYLDLQEQTRQDRYYEARADQLNRSASQLNMMIIAVILLILIVVSLLFAFNRLRRKNGDAASLDALLEPLERWRADRDLQEEQQKERCEELEKAVEVMRKKVADGRKRLLEQRAKMSIVLGVTPFIDRMLNEISRLERGEADGMAREERLKYVTELTDLINEYNDMLTQWIQLRRGELSLNIESFPLQSLFDIVAKNGASFSLRGIRLEVEPSHEVVKADKTLTLFMINTIADNARRFTPSGGTVKVSSTAATDYVEISIADTGCGIDSEQASQIFNRTTLLDGNTHGFGLMNCKGIIEKYKKVSRIFSVCTIGVETEKGKGSRFFFRLPKGIGRKIMAILILLSGISFSAYAAPSIPKEIQQEMKIAGEYSDSAYYANIHGRYHDCVAFADSCLKYINRAYRKLCPNGREPMVKQSIHAHIPAEVNWLHSGVTTDYSVILEIRNETAVAALALHDWDLYRYNNKAYTQLYKELSADNTLGAYCQAMQQSENNKAVAVALLVILLLMIFPAYYFIYYRHVLYYRFCVERVKNINAILVSDRTDTDKLSQIEEVNISRFPDVLHEIVSRIKTELHSSVTSESRRMGDMEAIEDELRKEQFEVGRLHVVNNVLDNCLSTLKHETMYYPSHIRQLASAKSPDLTTIGEIARYYKSLYTLLTMQAVRQLAQVSTSCVPVAVSEIVPGYADKEKAGLRVRGDRVSLRELFIILQRQNAGMPLQTAIQRREDGYMEFRIRMTALKATNGSVPELFTPKAENIPYLLCRQIARDNGEMTNRRACGIEARTEVNGDIEIIVLLTAC